MSIFWTPCPIIRPTTFFAPLLPAIAVTKIVGMANKVRFQPVAFAPGSTEISPDQDRYLDEMAGILNGRPDVDVVLCAVAVPGELIAPDASGTAPASGEGSAAAPAAETAPDGAAAAPAVGVVDEAALLELGEAREKRVKDALVDKGVTASRVVLCTPEIDEEPGAAPRVEIGV